MGLLAALKSLKAGMNASAAFGRAQRMLHSGDTGAALRVARAGLHELQQPHVNRFSAPEGSALVSLTIFAEQVAAESGMEGPSFQELKDAEQVLEFAVQKTPTQDSNLNDQLQYIKSRLEARAQGAA
jgi:hypothetical protein